MSDNYHRLLLNKKLDKELIAWLLKDQKKTEKPNVAMKQKLNEIIRKENKK